MQAFIWDIQDSMYSDETGEADNLGPAPKAVMRSSSEMSEQMTRLSGSGERRASVASAQVSLPDDAGSGSVRGSLMGGSMGSATGYAHANVSMQVETAKFDFTCKCASQHSSQQRQDMSGSTGILASRWHHL